MLARVPLALLLPHLQQLIASRLPGRGGGVRRNSARNTGALFSQREGRNVGTRAPWLISVNYGLTDTLRSHRVCVPSFSWTHSQQHPHLVHACLCAHPCSAAPTYVWCGITERSPLLTRSSGVSLLLLTYARAPAHPRCPGLSARAGCRPQC